jgi:sec-independent protein translocase protein TatB
MFGIGPLELGIVLVIALLILGPKKLPELARGLGKGLSEFRRASNDLRHSLDLDLEAHKIEPPPAPAQTSAPHLPPDLGSALDQAERDAERDAERNAERNAERDTEPGTQGEAGKEAAAVRPEPAPAPPTSSAAPAAPLSESQADSHDPEAEEQHSEEEDEGDSSALPRGGTGSPGG